MPLSISASSTSSDWADNSRGGFEGDDVRDAGEQVWVSTASMPAAARTMTNTRILIVGDIGINGDEWHPEVCCTCTISYGLQLQVVLGRGRGTNLYRSLSNAGGIYQQSIYDFTMDNTQNEPCYTGIYRAHITLQNALDAGLAVPLVPRSTDYDVHGCSREAQRTAQ